MIHDVFKTLAKENHYRYRVENYKVDGTIGSKLPITIYHLVINYNETLIKLKYEFGNHNLAEITCCIQNKTTIPDFKISTINHFTRLFRLKPKIYSIACKDKPLSKSLIKLLNTSKLTTLAEQEAFEPDIIGYMDTSNFRIYTRYYLGFNNKAVSITRVINFYKAIIDLLLAYK